MADNKNKKSSLGKILIGVFGALIGIITAAATAAGLMWKRISRKMTADGGQNNMAYIAVFLKNHVVIGADATNVYLSCACGSIKAEMPAMSEHDTFIDVFGFLGHVNLWVPEGVRVCCDVSLPCGGTLCEELAEANETVDAPTVYVTGQVTTATLNIRRIAQ